jgi:GntR family transcriptional regulator, transcriptional repressor for pyruvate dehydrogenase complex
VFTPVRTRRSFEEALDQIAERIKTGDLKLGERLPSEREMASEMDISRPTLREALKLLSTAGIIEVRPRSGGMILVQDFIPPDLLREKSELRMDEVGAVLEARRLLETQIAQLAGRAAGADDFEKLRATIELQRKHAGERDRLLQIDERFHLAMARATGNPMLLDMLRMVLKRLAIVRDMSPRTSDEWDMEVAIHVRTLEALQSREPPAIDEAMDEHLSYLETAWEQATGRRVPRPPLTQIAVVGTQAE